ncbi:MULTISPECIES: S1C family serine protease [unclassified Streptomyces]|uniref:S1C family serine protease n=1 Tax=unclassified Streptomyces TaxID=2593676 RepID=UPI001BE96DEC|nr:MULTISPECIES: trypsin-like peptidase domain-containing protein [unclassified Streptomyces]MBT2408334.1 trypsin-like peptidase domain-containing protein [Streptomyces sp. ISL-21]MBT2611727.1 trypsin-like peptidase domain-containing protein [Streptomyces sp. ISL-87]
MTDSHRREGEYPQHLAQETAAGAYPSPPAYPPAAPGWHEAHQPPVIQGETVPPGGGDSQGPAAPAGPSHAGARAKRPVALLAAVAIAAALIGGGTAAAVEQLFGDKATGVGGVSGTNVSHSNTGSGTISGVAEQVSPSVVRIDTRTASGQGTGSGVVITAAGEIVTNNHVVSGATEIQVTMSDGKKYSAKIVGTDPDKDLALIKLQGASGLKPARLGDSGGLKVGEQVVAIGSPDRLTGTVTSGIVSALNREVNVPKSEQQSPSRQQWPFSYDGQQFNGKTGSDTTSYKAIQTDASLNPGNSGGALVNMNGEIVGMPSAIYSPSSDSSTAGSVGLGFAIPVNTIKADLGSLRKGGSTGNTESNGTNGFGTSY